MKVEITDIGQLHEVAQKLLTTFSEERFFAFFGKMGVGKTTLIKEICDVLGVEDVVCSPTFAIVNEYSRPVAGSGQGSVARGQCEPVEERLGSTSVAEPVEERLGSTSVAEPVYHFDFYRLKSVAEAYDIGYEEYFYSGCYCFTEWTEKVEELLPEHYVRVDLEEHEGKRLLKANIIDE